MRTRVRIKPNFGNRFETCFAATKAETDIVRVAAPIALGVGRANRPHIRAIVEFMGCSWLL